MLEHVKTFVVEEGKVVGPRKSLLHHVLIELFHCLMCLSFDHDGRTSCIVMCFKQILHNFMISVESILNIVEYELEALEKLFQEELELSLAHMLYFILLRWTLRSQASVWIWSYLIEQSILIFEPLFDNIIFIVQLGIVVLLLLQLALTFLYAFLLLDHISWVELSLKYL